MKKKIIFLVFGLFVIRLAYTQSDELNELTVDRPGIAESPFTVAPGMFQFETGFDYYKRYNGDIYFLPVSLFRTGLSKNAELRVSVKNIQDNTSTGKLRGISPLTIGIKTHIIEQRGWIPETDILADIIVPVGRSDLNPSQLGHDILLLFQNDLSTKAAINYNVGLVWDGFSSTSIFTSSVCFNYLPSDRLGLFIEYFDFIRKKGTEEHGIDGGMTYRIDTHLQLDLSVGASRLNNQTNLFISSGFSIRLVRNKRENI